MTPAPAIVLDVTDKNGRQFRIHRSGGQKEYTIGRGYETYYPHPSIILIPDPMVSRKHCSLTWDNVGCWLLEDIGSTNGTIVNGQTLKDICPLHHGGEFRIGGCLLRLEFESPELLEEAETQIMAESDEPMAVAGGVNVAVAPQNAITVGLLTLQPDIGRAYWNSAEVNLTLTEFKIVDYLARRGGKDVRYRELYDQVRGEGFVAGIGEDGYRANVRAFIKRIRQKFREVDDHFDQIQNYPGFGYRWRADN